MFPFCLNKKKKIPKITLLITIYSQGVSHGIMHSDSQYVFIVEMGKVWVEGSSSSCSVYFQNLNIHK